MTLAKRLARLELADGVPLQKLPALDLCPNILRRITAAQAAAAFPNSLSDADLEAILVAGDRARGQA